MIMKKIDLLEKGYKLEDRCFYFIKDKTDIWHIAKYYIDSDFFVTFDRNILDADFVDINEEKINFPLTDEQKMYLYWEEEKRNQELLNEFY